MQTGTAAIQTAYAAGKQAWPDVALTIDQFEGGLGTQAEPNPDDLAAHGADLYLAVACARHEPAALKHFDEILTACGPALRRYDGGEAFVGEVIQRVRIQMLVAEGEGPPRVARYDARASMRAWLGVCAIRMALHVLRTARNAREIATDWPDTIAALPTGQPELEEVRTRYAGVFNTAWREACAALPARQRTLLKMCFVEGCAIDTIASTYGVHRVTVWRWLEDAKQKLLEGTRARLGEKLAPGAPGTASLLELVRSQLDLGLSVLEPDGPAAR